MLQIDQDACKAEEGEEIEEIHHHQQAEVNITKADDKDGGEKEQINGNAYVENRCNDIGDNEVEVGSNEVTVEVDGNNKIHPMKDTLATWVHEQMDEIDCAIEVLKLGIKISTMADPNSFIDQEAVNLFSDSFAVLTFTNDFQLNSDVQNALAMQGKIDSTHDELIEGCSQIITLISNLTILLYSILEKVVDKRTTGLELSNEIKKIMDTDEGKIILSAYNIEL
jgi:hypothetical protein